MDVWTAKPCNSSGHEIPDSNPAIIASYSKQSATTIESTSDCFTARIKYSVIVLHVFPKDSNIVNLVKRFSFVVEYIRVLLKRQSVVTIITLDSKYENTVSENVSLLDMLINQTVNSKQKGRSNSYPHSTSKCWVSSTSILHMFRNKMEKLTVLLSIVICLHPSVSLLFAFRIVLSFKTPKKAIILIKHDINIQSTLYTLGGNVQSLWQYRSTSHLASSCSIPYFISILIWKQY